MKCFAASLVVGLMVTASAALPQSPPPTDAEPESKPERVLVPDPRYNHEAGDHVIVVVENGEACKDHAAVLEYHKVHEANDDLGLKQLRDKGRAVETTKGTGVLILKVHKYRRPARVGSFDQLLDQQRRDVLNESSLPPDIVEVRFTDGPLKGQAHFMLADQVGRLIDKPEPKPEPKGEAEKKRPRLEQKADPSTRPATLLRLGMALERAGQIPQALKYYREIGEEYPDSEPAEAAQKRIEAIENK